MIVHRRRKGVLTKGAVIDVVIGLGIVAVEHLVEGLVIDVVKIQLLGQKDCLLNLRIKLRLRSLVAGVFQYFFEVGFTYNVGQRLELLPNE